MTYLNQHDLDVLQEELKRLATERKEAIDGNMGFSFGYDPAVAAIDQQMNVVQARINIMLDKANSKTASTNAVRNIVVYDEKYDEYLYLKVGDIPSSQSGNNYTVNNEAALGPALQKCKVGQTISLGLVVSVDNSPLLSKQEHEQAKQYYRLTQQEAKVVVEKQRLLEEKLESQRRQKLREENEATAARRQNARRQQEEEKQREEEKYRQEINRQLLEARNESCITLVQAKSRLIDIKSAYQKDTSDKPATVHKLSVLKIRCQKSYEAASSYQNDPTGAGAIVGGLVGLFGGPIGAIIGAGIGAALGNAHKESSEKDNWHQLLQDVEDFLWRCRS